MHLKLAAHLLLAQERRIHEQLRRTADHAPLLEDAERIARRNPKAHKAQRSAAADDDLNAREAEVLRLIAIGRSNADIAMALSISLNTVATHVRNILAKTGSANRTEAAAYAMRRGLAP